MQEELKEGLTFKDLLKSTRRNCSSVYGLQNPHVAVLSHTQKMLFYITVKVLPVYYMMLDCGRGTATVCRSSAAVDDEQL